MGNHNYGEAFRAAIAALAFLSAGWQFIVRYIWARAHANPVGNRELVGAISTGVLLVGVGIANLTHLTAHVTISSFVITIGITLSLWTNYTMHRAIQYSDERDREREAKWKQRQPAG